MSPSLLALILSGIMLAESGGNPLAIGDDGISIGAYQINERFHAERAEKWGEYDPRDPAQARRIASEIVRSNYEELLPTLRIIDPSQWDDLRVTLAIASYRQGVAGVRENGPSMWYVNRVLGRSWR